MPGVERRTPLATRLAFAQLGYQDRPLQQGVRGPHLGLVLRHLHRTSAPLISGGPSVDPPK